MKSSDAQTLAAVMRARGTDVHTGREISEVPAGVFGPAGEGWLDALHKNLADVPSSRGGGLETRTEQATRAGGGDAQLLAAAHAVAAYWLSASQAIAIERAAEAVSSGGHAATIRVDYLTAEGGLAAVELVHPDLGALAIEVSLSGRTLSVLVTAETEHAAQAIREGQAALAQRLQEQGITLQALDVVVLRRRSAAREPKSKRQES